MSVKQKGEKQIISNRSLLDKIFKCSTYQSQDMLITIFVQDQKKKSLLTIISKISWLLFKIQEAHIYYSRQINKRIWKERKSCSHIIVSGLSKVSCEYNTIETWKVQEQQYNTYQTSNSEIVEFNSHPSCI